jgi:hypothetical protein
MIICKLTLKEAGVGEAEVCFLEGGGVLLVFGW